MLTLAIGKPLLGDDCNSHSDDHPLCTSGCWTANGAHPSPWRRLASEEERARQQAVRPSRSSPRPPVANRLPVLVGRLPERAFSFLPAWAISFEVGCVCLYDVTSRGRPEPPGPAPRLVRPAAPHPSHVLLSRKVNDKARDTTLGIRGGGLRSFPLFHLFFEATTPLALSAHMRRA